MDNPQDCSVTSSQDVIKNSPSTSGNTANAYPNKNGRKKKLKNGNKQFEWFSSFQTLCHSLLGSTSMGELLNVITVYTEHISRDVEASYSKPNRASKLKTNMINTLGFFHNCYIALKEPFGDVAYLEKMSTLLTMYFDMELKASRRGKESMKRITSKIISALFIFLSDTPEYILDTVLRARLTVSCYREICCPIFTTITQLPQSQEMNYVRCLLVFKLWKRMLHTREEKSSINRIAVARLSPPPAQVLEFIRRGLLANVLPTPSPDITRSQVTRYLMTKVFNVRQSIKAFLKMEAELKLNDFTSSLDSVRLFDEDEAVIPVENKFQKDYCLLESIWIEISKSPDFPEISTLSSPSTSDSSPLDVTFNYDSGISWDLEQDKTKLSKVKKSLFKPKTSKKNKQQKIKEKSKKQKEDMSKENKGKCSDIIKHLLNKLKSFRSTTSESQGCRTTSISKSEGCLESQISNRQVHQAPERILESNSSNDLKTNEKNLAKVNTLENEPKHLVENGIISQVSFVSKSCSESETAVVPSPMSPTIRNTSCSTKKVAEAATVTKCSPEGNVNKSLKSNENNLVKMKPVDEPQLELEEVTRSSGNYDLTTESEKEVTRSSGNNDLITKSEKEVTQSSGNDDLTTKSEKDVTRSSGNDDLTTKSEKEPSLVVVSSEATDIQTPVNKILISCKNFSKIGFNHKDTEIKFNEDDLINKESKEFKSSITISEDPSLAKETDGFKGNTLLFNNVESPADRILVDKIAQDLNAEDSICKNLKADSSGAKLSSSLNSPSQNICDQDIRYASLKSIKEVNPTLKSKAVEKSIGESVQSGFSEAILSPNDIPRKNTRDQVLSAQKHPEKRRSEENNDSHNNYSTSNSEEINSRRLGDGVSSFKRLASHQVKASEVISEVTVKVHQKLETESLQQSSSIIQELRKGGNVVSSDCNQESSEVTSSFENGQQLKNNSTSNQAFIPLFGETQDSKSNEIKKEPTKELFACMKASKPRLEIVPQLMKCDKNTQVPTEQPGYVVNKSNFITDSHSPSIPKSSNLHKQAFNLHKGLNTCLLHKILGEEDCLKSGCLLKNSVSEKLPKDLKEGRFPEIVPRLKQEQENSSELPSENSPSTVPSLWNPIAGIKLEKDQENSRNSDCVEGIRNTSSEFLVRSVTEACNFKELDYNSVSECDNVTANYDCDSDGEDRNLVIDEDIDSAKDHNETEDIELKHGLDCVQNANSNIIVSSLCVPNSNRRVNETDQQPLEKKMSLEVSNVPVNRIDQQQKTNNSKTLPQDETLKKDLAGKHKLPRIVESNPKSSSLRNSYINEPSNVNVRYQTLSNSEVLLSDNSTPYVSAQFYRGINNSSINKDVPNHLAQAKIIGMEMHKQLDVNANIGQTSPSCRVFSPYATPQTNDSARTRGRSRDPRLRSANANNNNYHLKSNTSVQSNVNMQPHQMKSLERISSVATPLLSPEVSKSASPRLVASPGRFEPYTQYNMGGKMTITNKPSNSPVERYCQRSPMGSVEQMHRKRDSPITKFQESSISNTSHTNLNTFTDGSGLKDNSNPSFHQYNSNELQKVKLGESHYDKSSSLRDPLCLVKNKEDFREMYDFEFNIFPIAQEIEVCSAPENVGGEWLYPVSSEITHPDWPVETEQNVIDSSFSYSQSQDQYMYTTTMKSDQGCTITEADQPCYIPLELQQIDNRHPNIVGKIINQEKLNLHLRTLETDYNLCCTQSKFKEFYLSQDVSPTIPVPFPPQGCTDTLNSSARCPCEQCLDNHQRLISNYNVLTHFRNSKIKPTSVMSTHSEEISISEKDQNGEFDSSLPLKKRKTLTNSKATEELILPSYPNTPMISIAQLELTGYDQGNQVIVPNPQSQWRDSMAYNPLNLVQPPSLDSYDGQTRGKRKASKRKKSSR